MTTITTTTEAVAPRHNVHPWRFVVTFAAGVALAGGLAVGISAARDDSSPAHVPHRPVQAAPAPVVDTGCNLRVPGPC